MHRYLDVRAYNLEDYIRYLNTEVDIYCIDIIPSQKKIIFDYLSLHKNNSTRYLLAYIYLCYQNYNNIDECVSILYRFGNDDSFVIYLKYLYASEYNVGKQSVSELYNLSRQTGPYLYRFEDDNDMEKIIFYKDTRKIQYRGNYERFNNQNDKAGYFYYKLGYEMGSVLCAKWLADFCSNSTSKEYFNIDLAYEAYMYVIKNDIKMVIKDHDTDTNCSFKYKALWELYMNFYYFNDERFYTLYQNVSPYMYNRTINQFAYALGSMLGIGQFKKDYQKAYEIFKKYENSNFDSGNYANYFLGMMYKDGLYVYKNNNKAKEYFKKVGYVSKEAMYELGMMYYYENNYQEAIYYFNEAVSIKYPSLYEYGLNRAVNMLGWLYSSSNLIPKDVKKALEYYEKSYKDGGAMNNAGILYEYELKDINKAFSYYQKSAEFNDPAGMWNLAICYYSGKGCPVNKDLFTKYGLKAKELKNQGAIDYFK